MQDGAAVAELLCSLRTAGNLVPTTRKVQPARKMPVALSIAKPTLGLHGLVAPQLVTQARSHVADRLHHSFAIRLNVRLNRYILRRARTSKRHALATNTRAAQIAWSVPGKVGVLAPGVVEVV